MLVRRLALSYPYVTDPCGVVSVVKRLRASYASVIRSAGAVYGLRDAVACVVGVTDRALICGAATVHLRIITNKDEPVQSVVAEQRSLSFAVRVVEQIAIEIVRVALLPVQRIGACLHAIHIVIAPRSCVVPSVGHAEEIAIGVIVEKCFVPCGSVNAVTRFEGAILRFYCVANCICRGDDPARAVGKPRVRIPQRVSDAHQVTSVVFKQSSIADTIRRARDSPISIDVEGGPFPSGSVTCVVLPLPSTAICVVCPNGSVTAVS